MVRAAVCPWDAYSTTYTFLSGSSALLSVFQGRDAAAESMFARAMGIWEENLGPKHPNVAIALSNWSTLLMTQVGVMRSFR